MNDFYYAFSFGTQKMVHVERMENVFSRNSSNVKPGLVCVKGGLKDGAEAYPVKLCHTFIFASL
jgi:hypothetical protein